MAHDTFRIKLPIQELVTLILDELPGHVWTDPHIRFLDPAMAGGQFIMEIERRLKAAGHSDENIADRVYGCEERLIRVKYVQNWHKALSKHLYVRDTLTHDWGLMKFDVIVGNPPYQSNDSTMSLWPLFVEKSLDLLQPNGHLAFVTPATWMRPSNDIKRPPKEGGSKQVLADFMKTWNTKVIDTGHAKKYFDVGSTITWYVIEKTAYSGTTTVIDPTGNKTQINLQNYQLFPINADVTTLNIFEKVQTPTNKFDFKGIQGPGKADLECQKDKNKAFKYQYVGSQYSQKNFDAQHECVMYYSKTKHPDYHLPKIIINYIGDIKPYVDDGNAGMQYCQVHYLDHVDQVAPARSIVKSKLWKFIYQYIRYGMHNEKGPLNSIGIPTLDKVYTDQEIYKFYGLSKDEIALVERSV